MSHKQENEPKEVIKIDSSPPPAEFMEPEPPILANEVSMLVDCFKVRFFDLQDKG